jgi:uncharacterized membrane protein
LAASAASAQDEPYQFIPIEVPGGYNVYVYDVNNRDVVTGVYMDEAGIFRTFTWQKGQVTARIGYPGATFTSVVGINDHGVLYGNWGSDTVQHAAYYDPSTDTWTQLPDVPGKNINFASTGNNRGMITGAACNGSTSVNINCVGWVWDGEYTFFVVPGSDIPGTPGTFPYGMNDHNQVAGYSIDPSDAPWPGDPFLWDRGTLTSIQVLGLRVAVAYDINNRGQVTMIGPLVPNDFFRPFLWDRGEVTPLPLYPGSLQTMYLGLNDRGDSAGQYFDQNFAPHGFLAVKK